MTSKTRNYVRFKDTKYGPFDRCIFCDSDGLPNKLTDEHVVPKAFGGRAILISATCHTCRGITSRFETRVIHRMYAPLLARLEISSSGAKGLKNRFPLRASIGGNIEERRIPIGKYPTMLVLPEFEPALITRSIPSTDLSETIRLLSFTFDGDFKSRVMELLMETGATKIKTLPFELPLNDFRKMLAKIAHCYAISRLGIDGFIPLYGKAICDEAHDAREFVGQSSYKGSLETGHHHQLQIRELKYRHHDQPIISVFVRLMGFHERVPGYSVVVGHPNDLTEQRRQDDEARINA